MQENPSTTSAMVRGRIPLWQYPKRIPGVVRGVIVHSSKSPLNFCSAQLFVELIAVRKTRQLARFQVICQRSFQY